MNSGATPEKIMASRMMTRRRNRMPRDTAKQLAGWHEMAMDPALVIAEEEAWKAREAEREERERTQREAEQRQREEQQRAEAVRKQQLARAATQAELRQRLARGEAERQAQADRDRLSRLEAEAAARRVPQLTPEARKRQQTVAAYEKIVASLDAYIFPPRDALAEIDAMHAGLAAREAQLEERMAAQREAHRSANYQANQAAAIARRESGKW
jgi:hypothetical protein